MLIEECGVCTRACAGVGPQTLGVRWQHTLVVCEVHPLVDFVVEKFPGFTCLSSFPIWRGWGGNITSWGYCLLWELIYIQ